VSETPTAELGLAGGAVGIGAVEPGFVVPELDVPADAEDEVPAAEVGGAVLG
jgi:hypothetical protein